MRFDRYLVDRFVHSVFVESYFVRASFALRLHPEGNPVSACEKVMKQLCYVDHKIPDFTEHTTLMLTIALDVVESNRTKLTVRLRA
mgnify:CR=1 FL=1